MRVLCVDDDRLNALLFVESCRMAGGIEVEAVASGAEALDCVDDFRPDLLVIDFRLPDTDGFALLAQLRRRDAGASCAAVLFTGEAADDIGARARDAGFEACWRKPADLRVLVQALRRRGAAGDRATPSPIGRA